jgi:hypothetical protein
MKPNPILPRLNLQPYLWRVVLAMVHHQGELLRHISALKVRIAQFSKLCELEYLNGTVLYVSHGMISVCMYFFSAQWREG